MEPTKAERKFLKGQQSEVEAFIRSEQIEQRKVK